mmetsp:Transcript_80/g.163  ORF Transcript_80/g.163 Transcript_80/m.163 type:complete len:218 (+) Transcript_80:319-972(+)
MQIRGKLTWTKRGTMSGLEAFHTFSQGSCQAYQGLPFSRPVAHPLPRSAWGPRSAHGKRASLSCSYAGGRPQSTASPHTLQDPDSSHCSGAVLTYPIHTRRKVGAYPQFSRRGWRAMPSTCWPRSPRRKAVHQASYHRRQRHHETRTCPIWRSTPPGHGGSCHTCRGGSSEKIPSWQALWQACRTGAPERSRHPRPTCKCSHTSQKCQAQKACSTRP